MPLKARMTFKVIMFSNLLPRTQVATSSPFKTQSGSDNTQILITNILPQETSKEQGFSAKSRILLSTILSRP